MAATGTPATDRLRRAGVAHRTHEYAAPTTPGADRSSRPSYGADAAAALGIDPARLFKTLVATLDDRLALAVVPVAGDLDLKRLAAALGGRRATMADPAAAERATGYVIGGISPIGGRRAFPTVLDSSSSGFETIFVSAGRRGLQVELAPADLVAITEAVVAAIARP